MKHRYRFENGKHLAVVEDDAGKRVSEQAFSSAQAAIAARDKLFAGDEAPAAKPARKPRTAATTRSAKKK